MKERDYYFYLLRNEEEPNRVPATKRIASTAEVILEGEDSPTQIRYARAVKSIKSDEQGQVNPRNIEKPTFVKGVLVVKPHEKILLEYLRNHPANQNSKSRPTRATRAAFFEFDPERTAQEQLEAQEQEFNFYNSVFQLDYEKNIKPMCYLAGVPTDDSAPIVKRNFISWARENQDLYFDWLDKEFYVERTRLVLDAIEVNILRVEHQSVIMMPKTELVSFPMGHNVIEGFVNWTYGEGQERWAEVYRMLQSKLNRTHEKTSGDREIQANPLFDKLHAMNSDELLEVAIDKGIVNWVPPYYKFKSKQVGKGKERASRYLDSNPNMKKNIVLALVNKDNEEATSPEE